MFHVKLGASFPCPLPGPPLLERSRSRVTLLSRSDRSSQLPLSWSGAMRSSSLSHARDGTVGAGELVQSQRSAPATHT